MNNNTFALTKNDFLSSWSLFLISLPLTAGIAIASKAPPEAGIVSAIIGAIFFSIFSSSRLVVVGPAAGLTVFISAAATSSGDFYQLPLSVIISGVILMILSTFSVHKIIYVFPKSVAKGMAAGIGLILVLKMIPHLLGHDTVLLSSQNFIQTNGRNSFEEIFLAFGDYQLGAILISIVSLISVFAWPHLGKRTFLANKFSYAFFIVLLGIGMNEFFKAFYPALALSGDHMLRIETSNFGFHPFWEVQYPIWQIFKLGFILAALIILEGLVTLDIFQRLDPKHSSINFKKEIFLLGIGNAIIGFFGGLPVMPVLIRSKANLEFGAENRSSVFLHGIWILIVVAFFSNLLSYIPMAAVASILFYVGYNLIDIKEMNKTLSKGADQYVPFLTTLSIILFIDFFWGILLGFAVGLIYTLGSLTKRAMILVNDEERYLLKIFKDVTLFHKAKLRELMDSVPLEKELLVDGTGNIFIDPEMEEWFEEYAQERKERNGKIVFAKSNLAISKLFKKV